MDIDRYVNLLLSNLPRAKKVSGGREINCRCQYCPDSKNQNKGHFYISVPRSKDELSFFHCKKCQSSGVVTHNTLIEWGIYDPQVAIELSLHNKLAMNNPSNKIYNSDYVYNTKYNKITEDDLSKYKLNYINTRLGTSLTYKDCIRENIVLNLYDLLNENNITTYTRHPNIIEYLDSSFIGFLSIDRAFVNMRNLEIKDNLPKSIDKRYINYNVFGKYDNTHRNYVIPTTLDLSNPEPVKLHIAEGPFDILSVYHNLRQTQYNSIYSSINGNGYLGVLKFFIMTMKLVNLEIHYYVDNDVNDNLILYIAELIRPFNMNMFIHRNTYPNTKDFGVPLSKIKESIRLII